MKRLYSSLVFIVFAAILINSQTSTADAEGLLIEPAVCFASESSSGCSVVECFDDHRRVYTYQDCHTEFSMTYEDYYQASFL